MKLAKNIADIIKEIEPNPEREELQATPERVAESLKFLTHGYHVNIENIFHNALFESQEKDLVVIKDIEFYSMCEHHLLPFFGKCHIAYKPNQYILGLSKFGEIVDVFSRRLQIQERLTIEIAHCIQNHLKPHGLGIIMEAHHLCMKMRGIQKQNPLLITQKMMGCLEATDQQQLFFSLIQNTHQTPAPCQGDD
jgi:GTP cyclohydrolase I